MTALKIMLKVSNRYRKGPIKMVSDTMSQSQPEAEAEAQTEAAAIHNRFPLQAALSNVKFI